MTGLSFPKFQGAYRLYIKSWNGQPIQALRSDPDGTLVVSCPGTVKPRCPEKLNTSQILDSLIRLPSFRRLFQLSSAVNQQGRYVVKYLCPKQPEVLLLLDDKKDDRFATYVKLSKTAQTQAETLDLTLLREKPENQGLTDSQIRRCEAIGIANKLQQDYFTGLATENLPKITVMLKNDSTVNRFGFSSQFKFQTAEEVQSALRHSFSNVLNLELLAKFFRTGS